MRTKQSKPVKAPLRGEQKEHTTALPAFGQGMIPSTQQPVFAKIPKCYKLSEDVVDFLDRAHYHLKLDRTAIIEEVLRSKAQELQLPIVPKHKVDKQKEMKHLLKIK